MKKKLLIKRKNNNQSSYKKINLNKEKEGKFTKGNIIKQRKNGKEINQVKDQVQDSESIDIESDNVYFMDQWEDYENKKIRRSLWKLSRFLVPFIFLTSALSVTAASWQVRDM